MNESTNMLAWDGNISLKRPDPDILHMCSVYTRIYAVSRIHMQMFIWLCVCYFTLYISPGAHSNRNDLPSSTFIGIVRLSMPSRIRHTLIRICLVFVCISSIQSKERSKGIYFSLSLSLDLARLFGYIMIFVVVVGWRTAAAAITTQSGIDDDCFACREAIAPCAMNTIQYIYIISYIYAVLIVAFSPKFMRVPVPTCMCVCVRVCALHINRN